MNMNIGNTNISINIRVLLLIVVAVLFLVSAIGIQRAFSYPLEVEEEVVSFEYKHSGEFDYTAHLDESYLFNDFPLESSPYSTQLIEYPAAPKSNPKYPLEDISTIDMSYSYSFKPDQDVKTRTSTEIEIYASIRRPAEAPEDIILLPVTVKNGDFTATFTITGEQLASVDMAIITVDTYTTVESMLDQPMYDAFTQTITISAVGPLIEIGGSLVDSQRASFGEYSYEQTGEFDYSVQFKRDSTFGAIVLTPPSTDGLPSPPPTLSSMTLGFGDSLFYNLLDSMDLTFSYQFESDDLAMMVNEDVSVSAVLENPGVWRKEFPLVPFTSKTGDFIVSFSLDRDDFNYFSDVYRVVERETGVSGSNTLTILADVYTTAESEYGLITERFTQTLSTTLVGDILTWEEEFLAKFQPGDIRTSQVVPNPERIMGLPVVWIRALAILLTVMLLILLSYLVALNVWFRPVEISSTEKEILRARKKHKDVIVDVKELPACVSRGSAIQLVSLDQLVKTADDLLKPVLHESEAGIHTYCVVDGSVRYEYICDI
jgi:hypothetical protein